MLILCLVQAFNGRFSLGPDGVSYLDLGEFWLKGDIEKAVNGYWNPIYPILLATACRFVPDPIHEPLMAHVVNFAVLALNLFLFSRLLARARALLIKGDATPQSRSSELFTVVAYLLFLWCHVSLNTLTSVTPDMLVTTSALASTICLFRLAQGERHIVSAVCLGVALAFGYLVKAIMFVAAPFFLSAALICARCLGKGLQSALVATLVFVSISAPYILLLSRQQGHWTYSESGPLAYSWMVNKTSPWFHWQGREPGSGQPAHPTRQLLDEPDIFEFSDRPGTYPPWFDPAYWNKGLRVSVNLKQQLKAINENLRLYHSVLFGEPVSILLLFLFASALGAAMCADHFRRLWPLLVPALAGPCIYLPVYALPRHLAPFVLLLYFVLLVICWPAARRRLPERAVIALIICGFLPLFLTLAGETTKTNLFKRGELAEQQRVAIALRRFGLKQGDRIAVMGRACDANFARFARLKIVAEAFREASETPLWARVPDLELKTVDILRTVPTEAIVSDTAPTFNSTLPWRQIPNTRFAVLFPPRQTGVPR